MSQSPSRRPRRRQRSFTLLRALLALAVLALFGGVCVAALADIAHATEVLTIVAPLVAVVLGFYFEQRCE